MSPSWLPGQQTWHSLQSATRAEADGADIELVVAVNP